MNAHTLVELIAVVLVLLIIVIPIVLIASLWLFDTKQKEHAVLRNYPVLGKIRYIFEKMGPELRQYLFLNDTEGKPFSRKEYTQTVLFGKYKSRMMGFGSERDFQKPGYYIANTLFPKQKEELKIQQNPKVKTKVYVIDHEKLFSRKEHREEAEADPYLLTDENAPVIGKDSCRQPFQPKGLVGQSAMSYGALGKSAITALSTGLGMAGGTWMNTGEGGLTDHHLKGGVDIISQIGPGLFGYRTKDGNFSWEEFKKKSKIPEVKAFELKLAQGAKTRGGHVDGKKVTPEIAEIRNVEAWKSIDSPNRFREFGTFKEMFDFVEQLREIGGKPVGIKLVVGHTEDIRSLASYMARTGQHPDFITIDGAEGGTGASFQELADSAGVPILSALPYVHDVLQEFGVRDKVHIFASGKLLTPDKVALALALGADFVNIARGMMFSVGCIQAQVCHTNTCPVGVATTDPKLQKALDIEEKSKRVCNYILSLREGIFTLAAAAGIDSPTKFTRDHIVYRDSSGMLIPVKIKQTATER
ncbi:FMN-binding glutamate synthase family protein [Bacillus sp. 1P06AnD]|uniref:FMN-binding glutamate synthase family protein n=1 Tax=Bacillus sp. 1P06AnD TaxID=3132208 RepID=UPI0039A3E68E